jgi:hypothetical protein
LKRQLHNLAELPSIAPVMDRLAGSWASMEARHG